MPRNSVVAISKIVMKLSRIAVTPDHVDSWADIAGYAQLERDRLQQLQDEEDAHAR